MLLPDTDREMALHVAERVRTAITDIRVLEGDSSISASFGVEGEPRSDGAIASKDGTAPAAR